MILKKILLVALFLLVNVWGDTSDLISVGNQCLCHKRVFRRKEETFPTFFGHFLYLDTVNCV